MKKQMKTKFEHWFSMFLAYKGRTVYEAYKKPSGRKVSIWEMKFARQICPTILGHNSFVFTVGYLEKDDGKLMFCVDTYGGHHQFELNAAEKQSLKEAKIYV